MLKTIPWLVVLALPLGACCKSETSSGAPPNASAPAVAARSAGAAPKAVKPASSMATNSAAPTAPSAEQIEEMFGNELDQVPAEQKFIKTAAVEVAKLIGKNDAEGFIAHMEDSFVLATKRLSKAEAAAKIREKGLQKTLQIEPLQGVDKTPYGIGWRLTSLTEANIFGVTSGSGYGPSWVVSCRGMPDGSFVVTGVRNIDLGSP